MRISKTIWVVLVLVLVLILIWLSYEMQCRGSVRAYPIHTARGDTEDHEGLKD